MLRHMRIEAIIETRPGYTMVAGRVSSAPPASTTIAEGDAIKALVLEDNVGPVSVGQTLLVEVSALAKRLGTGGFAMCVANLSALPADVLPADGHIVKARYTPSQTMVASVDEQDSPHFKVLENAEDLGGMPVVVADLHSALPAIVAGIRLRDPLLRVVYVHTDGAALPLKFSSTVAGLKDAGWIDTSITCGQSYGGDLEAINVYTALLAAKHVVGADIAVVAQGPGNAGTGTRWGFSGVEVGNTLNAARVLGGKPVACLRVSSADKRPRHYGVSHHSMTVLTHMCLGSVVVPVPELAALGNLEGKTLPQGFIAHLSPDIESLKAAGHTLVETPIDGLYEALQASPIKLSTMGRSLNEDPAAFLFAGAAGAASMASVTE